MELVVQGIAPIMENRLTFEGLIETYFQKKDLKPTSRIAYRSAFKQFGAFLEERNVHDIGEQEIVEYKEYLMAKNLSVFTRISNLRAIKSLFSFMEHGTAPQCSQGY